LAVTIQQAAANALARYLTDALSGVTVEARWPAPERQLPDKMITILLSGPRRDEPMEHRMVSREDLNDTQVSAHWQIAACHQPLQLDIWATQEVARDDILAQLDQVLNAGELQEYNPWPVGNGILLPLEDGWEDFETYGSFYFENPDTTDTPDSVKRREFRATFSGGVDVMLVVPKTSARQTLIRLSQRLYSTGEPSGPTDDREIT